MKKHLLTEDDVKKALDISDFRSISKDKIMQFVSMIPNIDKEVAIKIVDQFPNYSTMATSMVNKMLDLCNNVIAENKVTEKEAINSYKTILETIKKELEDGEYTPEEKIKFNNQMIENIRDWYKEERVVRKTS